MSDLISREDAIEMLQEAIDSYPPTMKGQGRTRDSTLEEAIDLIKSIPNAETTGALDDAIQEYIKDGYILAEPLVGKWEECKVVDIEDTTITEVQSAFCPICRKYHTTPYMYYFDYFAYCPNCGAKMERSE